MTGTAYGQHPAGITVTGLLDELFPSSWACTPRLGDSYDLHVHPDFKVQPGVVITGAGYLIKFFPAGTASANNEELLLLLNQGE